jgi:hypothetical protein
MTQSQKDYEDFVDSIEDELDDESEASTGYTARVIPEGIGLLRLVEYVELGAHVGMYQGKPKKKADDMVRIAFELSGKNFPTEEIEVDGVKVQRPHIIRMKLNKSTNEKSKYFKLFKLLNWEGKAKHMAQLAARNAAAKVKVVHNTKGEGKDAKTYANIYAEGAWLINAPFREDPETGDSVPITVAPALSPTKIFLFQKPRLQDWALLYIEGTKDDGTSKNYIQDEIKLAVNFPGSPLEAMLAGAELGEEPAKKEAPKEEKKPNPPKTDAKKQKGDDLGDI